MFGLYILIVLCLVATGILLWLCLKAPLGHEDEEGYHDLSDDQ